MLRQNCTLVAAVLLIGATFVAVYAAKHDGVCVPAKTKLSIISGSCQVNAQGRCVGNVTAQDVAVHGYCDTDEDGDCYDATATFLVASGQYQLPCAFDSDNQCAPNGSSIPADAYSTVSVNSCTQ